MKLIRRHIQSLSLVAIAGLLLAGAFFISLQTRSGEDKRRPTITPHVNGSIPEEIPTCTDVSAQDEQLACYVEAVRASDDRVIFVVDELLAKEPESARRLAFLDTQFAWEVSRDADCAFLRDSIADPGERELQERICLLEHNLLRLEQLERFRCEWYDPADCADEDTADE
ncbi:MAG: DUF1311 domain-containing protein [Brevefilum sp.]|nr:DUF1311 domain-containing protein [Brevefilum sp.]